MEVRIYTGDTTLLSSIIEFWRDEVAKDFGIELIMEEYLSDLQNMVDSPDKDLLVLYDKDPIGYMGLVTFKNPMGTELFANEHYWYIIPERRRGMGAVRLMRAAQEWAKRKGCKFFLVNASKLASDLHDNVCKFYERFGFRHFETTFIRGV